MDLVSKAKFAPNIMSDAIKKRDAMPTRFQTQMRVERSRSSWVNENTLLLFSRLFRTVPRMSVGPVWPSRRRAERSKRWRSK
jgi:hypothetical protein